MKSIAARIEKYILKKEQVPSTALHVAASLLFIGIARYCLEVFPDTHPNHAFFAMGVVVNFAFYIGSFFLFFLLLSTAFPHEIARARSVVLLGMFGGLLPPLITPFFSSQIHGYGYMFEFAWNFAPPGQIIGQSIGLWCTTFVVGAYFLYKKRTLLSFLFGFAGAYAVLQFSQWFITIPGTRIGDMLRAARPDIVPIYFNPVIYSLLWTAVSLACFLWIRREYMRATVARFPHTIMRFLVVLLGAAIGGGINAYTILIGIVYALGFMLIQAENDYYDKELDALNGRESSITYDDVVFVRLFMLVPTVTLILIFPSQGVMLALFFLLGFIYNHSAFRYKKHFVTATLVEGGLAFAPLVAGAFTAGDSMSPMIFSCIIAATVIFALLANVRDYKDFSADKKGGIRTLYVTLSERGFSPEKTHRLMLGLFSLIYTLVLAYFGFRFHPALSTFVPGAGIVACSAFPFILVSQKSKNASSVAAVTVAALFLAYTCFYLLPLMR
jgi:4-hydroxybenzoate polyprenyltransferase